MEEEGRDIHGRARVTDPTGTVVAEFTSRFRLARADAARRQPDTREDEPCTTCSNP